MRQQFQAMYMTFHTKFNTTKYNKESGVTLMLAVLVLSAIVAIAFSLATIVFIEIRSSGDTARTEPALYGTLGVTEEALFQYKRFYTPGASGEFNVPTCDGPKASHTCDINGVNLTLPGSQPLAFDTSPTVEFIPASTSKVIPMYVANSYNQVYQSVTLEVLPNYTSSGVHVNFQVTDSNGGTNSTVPTVVSPGQVYTYNSFTPTGQYELVLDNQNSLQDLSVKIATVRVGQAQPNGLPFVGQSVLRIVADYLGLTRTYQVNIPIP